MRKILLFPWRLLCFMFGYRSGDAEPLDIPRGYFSADVVKDHLEAQRERIRRRLVPSGGAMLIPDWQRGRREAEVVAGFARGCEGDAP